MASPDSPTLEHVLMLARRLPPADQARLVMHLEQASVTAPSEARSGVDAAEDPWAILARVREEFGARGPVASSVTEELLASRR